MQNPVYKYRLNIYDLQMILLAESNLLAEIQSVFFTVPAR